jgi:polar amino acid transport system permease protein
MFDWHFFWTHIFHLSPAYLSALVTTIVLAVVGQIIGIIIGGFICLGRLSKSGILNPAAAIYTWFFRGVPELVLMVLLFSGVAAAGFFRFSDFTLAGITVSASLQAAIVAIGLREGAYMGEIIRNGVQSVRKGQIEASRALGMPPRKVLWKIVVPQAMRVIVPPFGNDFNVMLKVTTLASVIGVPELFLTTQTFASATFRNFELFIGLAINYLLLTTAWSIIQSLIEARLRRHEAASGQLSLLKTIQAHLTGSGPGDEAQSG